FLRDDNLRSVKLVARHVGQAVSPEHLRKGLGRDRIHMRLGSRVGLQGEARSGNRLGPARAFLHELRNWTLDLDGDREGLGLLLGLGRWAAWRRGRRRR